MDSTSKLHDEPSSKKSCVKEVAESIHTMQTVFKDIGSGIQQLVTLEAKRTNDNQYKEFHDLVKLMSHENILPEFIGMMKGHAKTLAETSGYKHLQTPIKATRRNEKSNEMNDEDKEDFDDEKKDDHDSDDDDSNKWLHIGI
jgi:hypothetical protein